MKFKVGDRVAVYSYNEFVSGRSIGVIQKIDTHDNTVLVETDENFKEDTPENKDWFQTGQCRRLVKKKRECKFTTNKEFVDLVFKLENKLESLGALVLSQKEYIEHVLDIRRALTNEDFSGVKERLDKLERLVKY